jgi:hypothetical protein
MPVIDGMDNTVLSLQLQGAIVFARYYSTANFLPHHAEYHKRCCDIFPISAHGDPGKSEAFKPRAARHTRVNSEHSRTPKNPRYSQSQLDVIAKCGI